MFLFAILVADSAQNQEKYKKGVYVFLFYWSQPIEASRKRRVKDLPI